MNWRFITAASLAAAIGLSGCGGGGAQEEEFFYRMSNAIPHLAGGIDFMVDKKPEATALAYDADTDYVETDLEETNIFFDILDNSTGEFLDAIVWKKEDNQDLHLFAVGIKNGPQTLQPPAQIASVVVNRTTPQGNSRLVFVHGYCRKPGTQTPNVDLMRTGSVTPVVEDLAFADSQTFVLPSGAYRLTARYAGLKSGEFLTSDQLNFEPGKVYIVLLEGVEDAAAPFEPKFRVFEEPIRDP
jgi:hypothetical protein